MPSEVHAMLLLLLPCFQDIERGVVDTQLIAHDREVFDIAWGGVGVFATVSADGSVRVFDLRCVSGAKVRQESILADLALH